MADVQNHELPLHQTAEPETLESHSVEANRPAPVKRLDGEVKREGEMAFSGGMYCEVWIGIWEKGSGEKGREDASGDKVGDKGMDGKGVDFEKVRLCLTTSVLLT